MYGMKFSHVIRIFLNEAEEPGEELDTAHLDHVLRSIGKMIKGYSPHKNGSFLVTSGQGKVQALVTVEEEDSPRELPQRLMRDESVAVIDETSELLTALLEQLSAHRQSLVGSGVPEIMSREERFGEIGDEKAPSSSSGPESDPTPSPYLSKPSEDVLEPLSVLDLLAKDRNGSVKRLGNLSKTDREAIFYTMRQALNFFSKTDREAIFYTMRQALNFYK